MKLDSSAITSIRRLAALALAMAFLYGCAATPAVEQDAAIEGEDDPLGELYGDEDDYDDGANDPLEIPNRFIFAINGMLDFVIVKPVSHTYNFWVPDPVRESIGNFLHNISSPVILANDVFQGEHDRAETTFKRFFINTTVGLLGFFDPATDWGYERHTEDFGQTLATYGAGEGFYLMLPLLGVTCRNGPVVVTSIVTRSGLPPVLLTVTVSVAVAVTVTRRVSVCDSEPSLTVRSMV